MYGERSEKLKEGLVLQCIILKNEFKKHSECTADAFPQLVKLCLDYEDLRVVAHFPSEIVERTKRERT